MVVQDTSPVYVQASGLSIGKICHKLVLIIFLSGAVACGTSNNPQSSQPESSLSDSPIIIDRKVYVDRMHGFWLGQSIANWTGLTTEMDRVTAPFYTDNDWGQPDQKSMWGEFVPHTDTIDFYFVTGDNAWGADDDTDIEYMYQYLLEIHKVARLSAQQIQQGWLHHIYKNEDAPFYKKFPDSTAIRENHLWESNEQALQLMVEGVIPPATSEPQNNPKYSSIDAQLTTEIFGLFAPCSPQVALDIAHLPIRVSANNDAAHAAQFYVVMHSLAACTAPQGDIQQQLLAMADQARHFIPSSSYIAHMYDFVKQEYTNNPDKTDWEATRDAVYERYQRHTHDGYVYQQSFDAGINFAASLVSLFYGQGDFKNTLRIGTLAGWDSDNPTATWGGLLGFMLGKKGVEEIFKRDDLSHYYWIHRTRRNFPDRTPHHIGEDTFSSMAQRSLAIIDRVVVTEIGGKVELNSSSWVLPANPSRL